MSIQIKELFDPAKDIYRKIEKVITYSASQETRLKAEITEYIGLFAVSSGLRELELAGNQIRHGNQIVRIPVASRFGLGRLDETIDPFQKAVGQS